MKKVILIHGLIFFIPVIFSMAVIFIINPGPAFAVSYTYYSPEANLQKIDIYWLKKAVFAKRLYIAMYSFTDYKIAKELIKLAHEGVKIYIYRDDKQMKDRTDRTYMLEHVRNIYIKAKRDKGFWNIMHDKIFIIPGIVFREGSANWSPSAEGASCYYGNCGSPSNQDNNATYITNKYAIKMAIVNFIKIWDRKSNIIY